jgi:hypothetical protein
LTQKSSSRLIFIVCSTVVSILAGPAVCASGLSSLGAEFHVNTDTEGAQNRPDLATDDGVTLAVWSKRTLSTGLIEGQLIAADGSLVGSEFEIAPGDYPSAAALPDVGFIVVWSDLYFHNVNARIFDGDGEPSGAIFRVSEFTGSANRPQVAAAPDGTMLVVWDASHPEGDDVDILGRFVDAGGTPSGSEFLVNSDVTGREYFPSVAATPGNEFLVVWEDRSSGFDVKVRMQRYAASGERLGDESTVNEILAARRPSVVVDDTGEILVTWAGFLGSAYDIIGRRLDAAGHPATDEFQVNVATFGTQHSPRAAFLGAGHFVVVWASRPYSSQTEDDVLGRIFDSTGEPMGGEFQLASNVDDYQEWPDVTALSATDIMAVWSSKQEESEPIDFYRAGIYGQRFSLGSLRLAPRIPALSTVGLLTATLTLGLAAIWILTRTRAGK